MIIHVKNKDTLIVDDFCLKCCIGKNGLNSRKMEGDYSTPKGLFKLKKLYYRKDRVGIPNCKIKKKLLQKKLLGVMILIIKNIMRKLIFLKKIPKKIFLEKITSMII